MWPQCEEVLASEETVYLEERTRIIARVDDLKRRVSELERQLQETRQEVSYTCSSAPCRALPQIQAVWAVGVHRTFQDGLYFSAGGDGAGPAAGREASRAAAGGG